MSARPGLAQLQPLILRAVARTGRPPPYALARRVPATAILIARRGVGTETSTSGGGGGGNFPPPGFNAEQAKRPLPEQQQEQKKQAAQAKEAQEIEAQIQKEAAKDNPLRLDDSASQSQSTKATTATKADAAEDKSLSKLAAEKAAADKSEEKKIEKKKEEDKKLTLWQKVKREAVHYWDGTKLLATEVRISSKLALKMAAGYELTRREHRQLHRTVQDLGRLVPFSVFVIVPFAELLLPVALRLFPNLLPSTYEGQKAKDTKAAELRKARNEVSKFLRQTLKETGLPVSASTAQREEFAEFFRKVRSTGEQPTAADVIKVCKTFKDDLTLDNLSRPQLVGICRYMNLNTFGTDALLRYQIRHHMRQIKRDDKAISFEGVESLSVPELQSAAAQRGLRTQGASPARLRDDLQMWLDLRLKYGVPSTLLVLSSAFVYAQGKDTELSSQIDALQAVLSSVPEELFHEIELEVHTAEGAATNKQRLEVLKEQQELIEEELNQDKSSAESGQQACPADRDNIDEHEEHSATEEAIEEQEDNEADRAWAQAKGVPGQEGEKKN